MAFYFFLFHNVVKGAPYFSKHGFGLIIFFIKDCVHISKVYLDEYCVWKKDYKNLFVQHSIDGITSRFSQVVSKLWQI